MRLRRGDNEYAARQLLSAWKTMIGYVIFEALWILWRCCFSTLLYLTSPFVSSRKKMFNRSFHSYTFLTIEFRSLIEFIERWERERALSFRPTNRKVKKIYEFLFVFHQMKTEMDEQSTYSNFWFAWSWHYWICILEMWASLFTCLEWKSRLRWVRKIVRDFNTAFARKKT